MLSKVRFKTENGLTHIFLDDQEVKGCIKANFDYEVNSIPVVQLTIQAIDVEVDADCADVCRISEEPIEILNLTARTINILYNGIWYNKNHERMVDPVRTIGKLLEEYNAGRLMKYEGLGGHRYMEIYQALKERGLI